MKFPTLPNYGDGVLDADTKAPATLQYARDVPQLRRYLIDQARTGRRFTKWWYDFFNSLNDLVGALRNFPPSLPQANLAKLTAKLTKSESGTQVWISDFNHLLRWDGVAWDFAPGSERSNWYALFEPTGPLPAAGSGWVLGDGVTPYNVLAGDGTISAVIPAAAANTYFRV